jgi:eukaryotic translation initiation factor 2C
VDVSSLKQFNSSHPDRYDWDKEPTLNAFNILVSKCFDEATGQAIRIGANKFYIQTAHDVLWTGRDIDDENRQDSSSLCNTRGYYYSVRPGIDKILLNVNAATSAFYMPQCVSDFMLDTFTWEKMDLEEALRGVRVYITYERGDPTDEETYRRLNSPESRVKRIEGLGKKLSSQTFTPKDNAG